MRNHARLLGHDDDHRVRLLAQADGRAVGPLHAGDRVEIVRSPINVRFARGAPLDFFTLLEDKLRWNAPLKERERGGSCSGWSSKISD